jgi:hypothetical protein
MHKHKRSAIGNTLTRSRGARVAFGALAVGAVIAGVPGMASAQGTTNGCSYNDVGRTAILQIAGGGNVQLQVEGTALSFFDASGQHFCTSPSGVRATVENTKKVSFIGTQGTTDDFIVSLQGGSYGNVLVDVFSSPEDIVDIAGSAGRDNILVSGGLGTGLKAGVRVNGINPNNTVSMRSDPKAIRVSALGGDDLLTGDARGLIFPGTIAHLELFGGAGNDTIAGGLRAGDKLNGGDGNDTLDSVDGQPFDDIQGGFGTDTAKRDTSDTMFGVENL